jgi:hypothetical protein
MDFRRIYRRITPFGQTQVRPGHQYTDTVTGEEFTVLSVGPNVQIERHDAEMVTEHSVPKEQMKHAIDSGIVVHNDERCSHCRQ